MKTSQISIAVMSAVCAFSVSGIANAIPTTESSSSDSCPALHLVLVNGTFDASTRENSTVDHGFGAQLAIPAMKEANERPLNDPSAGIALENLASQAEPFSTSSLGPKRDQSDSADDFKAYQDKLWGTGVLTSVPETSQKANPWLTSSNVAPTSAQVDKNERDVKIARTYVPYPAAAGGAFLPGMLPTAAISYEDSMKEGAVNTAKVLQEISSKCPSTKVLLSGHSQGAQVVSTVAREIGSGTTDISPDMIAGVALFSDPTRAKASPIIQSGADQPEAVPGTLGTNVARLGNFLPPNAAELKGGGVGIDSTGGKDFGALADRTASWCNPGDLVCDLPISGPLSELVISIAQKLDLDDPEKSLRAVSDTLSPAVIMGGVDDVQTNEFSYGGNGFHAAASMVADQEQDLVSRIAMSGAAKAQPLLGERAISDLGKSVIGGVSQLGGMALGAGMTILKEAVTVENLIQVAAAGVAGPEAALATAAAKLTDAALEVLTPETAVGAAQAVFDEVEVLGVSPAGLSQLVVEAAGHNQAHASYAANPSTKDGRSAMEATIDWAVAASRDISGEENAPQPPISSMELSATVFDSKAAQRAISEVKAWRDLQGATR